VGSLSDRFWVGSNMSMREQLEPDRLLPPYSLDHVIPLSELHFRRILAEFVDYYNHDRPHRSLALEPPSPTLGNRHGQITVRPVLGGLHHVYERAA